MQPFSVIKKHVEKDGICCKNVSNCQLFGHKYYDDIHERNEYNIVSEVSQATDMHQGHDIEKCVCVSVCIQYLTYKMLSANSFFIL